MRNIMLSFLSLVKIKDGVVESKVYPGLMSDGLGVTHTTNESGLRYVLQDIRNNNFGVLDNYLCFTSKAVTDDKLLGFDCTHLEYFKQRLGTVLSAYYEDSRIEDFIKVVKYDESSEKDVSLSNVLEMINIIKMIQVQSADHHLNVYLDLTGGPRDANMLLLMISKMLEYDKNITVKEVLYSNLVDTKQGIGQVQIISNSYKLLDFVAGIAEFVNFGSMKGLNRFFQNSNLDENDDALHRLLKAMNNFAKRIMLCRYGEFVETIEELKSATINFKESYVEIPADKKTAVYELLHSFLSSINEKYKLLFTDHANDMEKDLNIIKWCYENNYIQQAITLITERIPECLIESEARILNVNDNAFEKLKTEYQEYLENENSKLTFNTWLLFLRVVADPDSVKNLKNYNKVTKLSRRAFMCLKQPEQFAKVVREFEDLAKLPEYINLFNIEEVITNIKEYKDFYDCSDKDRYPQVDDGQDLYIHKRMLRHERYGKSKLGGFWKYYSNSDKLDANVFFEISGGKLYDETLLDTRKYPGNFTSIRNMLKTGVLYTKYDKAHVLELLLLYYEIKDERNVVNHAHNKKERITHDELMEKIRLLIERLECILYGETPKM